MTTRMLRNAIVATALIGAIATPSAMACGHGGGGFSGPRHFGGSYTHVKAPGGHTWHGRHIHRGRGDCNPAPPVVTPPVDPPPVVEPPPTVPGF